MSRKDPMRPMLPYWSCSALILEGEDEIDLDHETRAASAEDAEDDAREVWSDHGFNPEKVIVRKID
jgi:hypothetical protein